MASTRASSSRPSGPSTSPSYRSAPLQPSSTTTHSTAPQPPPSPHGFRAQFTHLLPRHALFHARVHIHELASVPLVSGQFALRWKFKNVYVSSGDRSGLGLLGIGWSKSSVSEHGGEKGGEDGEERGTDTTAVNGDSNSLSGSVSTEEAKPMIPSVVVSESHPSGSHSSATLFSSTSSSSSSTSSAPPASFSPTPSIASAPGPTPARSMTPYVPLREHTVNWSQTLSLTLKLPIDRNTSQLLPSPLKLVVQQRVIPDDPDAPRNPRLGAVRLDLAEYVDKGEVQRRYLLEQSRTNATLKLTIEVTPLHSPDNASLPAYIAPPLAKAEILGGIAGLLSDSDINRTRPRMRDLDIYGPLEPFPTPPPPLTARQSIWSRAREERVDEKEGAFDVRQLPDVYGPKTTETLIDALFNPVVTRDKAKANPFTIYVPPGSPDAVGGDKTSVFGGSTTGSNGTGAERKDELEICGNSTRSSDGSSLHASGGVRAWWRKISNGSQGTSRPCTPVQV